MPSAVRVPGLSPGGPSILPRDLYVPVRQPPFYPAAPVSPIRDDFNRADEAPLSQGGNWGRIQNGIGPLNLISNTVGNVSGSGSTIAMYRADFGSLGDQEAYCSVSAPPTISPDSVQILLRYGGMDAAANAAFGYRLIWQSNGVIVFVRINPDQSNVQKSFNAPSITPGCRLWGTAIGSVITGYIDTGGGFQLALQVSDTSFAAGAIGVGGRGAQVRIDNFGGTGQYVESITIPTTTTPSSTESTDLVESATISTVTIPSSTDPAVFVETGPNDFDTTVYPSDSNKSITDTAPNYKVGQGFTPSVAAVMPGGSIVVTRRGTPVDTLTVELHDDSAGTPGTVLATKTLTLSGLVQDVETTVDFVWPTPVNVTNGAEYFFVTYRTGSADAVNYWELGFSSTDALTGAEIFA